VGQQTLDAVMAAEGVDPATIGLLWMDTQGCEGHVLAGAQAVLAHSPPLVAECAPKYLRSNGGLPLMIAALAEHYTHFLDLRAPLSPEGEPELRTVDELNSLVEDYEARESGGTFTDILAVRLPG